MAVKDKGTSYEGFNALYDGSGNSGLTISERVTTKCVVDYELVRLCQDKGMGVCKAKPLGKMLELWPYDRLKRILIDHTRLFTEQIATQGYHALTGIYEFRVWGPYTEKVGTPHDFVPEADNPFIPASERQTATTVWGYQGDEMSFDKGCVFIIQGRFTRHAKYGHVEEETGVIVI